MAAGSCQRMVRPLASGPPRGAASTLRCSSATVFCPNHWNGVWGLGTKPAHRGHHVDRLRWWRRPISTHRRRQLGDAEDVLVALGGQADEEVQLHPPPALAEGGVDRAVEVLLGDQLVDDLAHPPRPALGREGEAGAAHLLDLRRRAHGEGVDPQRGRLTETRPPCAGSSMIVAHRVLDAREVGRRERREGHLVVAGPVETRRAPCSRDLLRPGARAPAG